MNTRHDISSFIPQRPPFVFIDTIEEVNEHGARTRFTVPAECPLVTDGILPLSGLMENAAQTCAARAGGTIGYIGAVKQMEVTRFPRVGETLYTEAEVIQEVLNISLIECTTRVADEVIASTTLKIAIIE
jgi:predicted hotdog family 3-hydroxylacyl-ACP dehydratase